MQYSREDVVNALKKGILIGAGLGAAYATKHFLELLSHEPEMAFLQDYQSTKGEWELYTGQLSKEDRRTIKRSMIDAWEQYAFSSEFNRACKIPGRFFYLFRKGESGIYICLRTVIVKYDSLFDSDPIENWIEKALPKTAQELTTNGRFAAYGTVDSEMIAFYDLTTAKNKEGKGGAGAMIDVIKQRLENDTTIKHIITISPENAEPLHLRKEARKIA
ncbi:MAG: hypothetical protein HZB65_01980, partial [Candidatus Aenigmarchaeota archaeon]|nr:hypothetical protein [Candidatus Aenigmarchaeota archaeon]